MSTRKVDFGQSTIPYKYAMDPVLATLERDPIMCWVIICLVTHPYQFGPFGTIQKRNSFAGSMSGSIRETQGAINFCNHHNIRSDVELMGFPDPQRLGIGGRKAT
ncbi:hypothetical protein [Pseudomonas pergaminensis]|jgi:uncharacterized zinc-type alcohol dehydrogenase-like protein